MKCRHVWRSRRQQDGYVRATVLTCVHCGKVLVQTFGAHEAIEKQNPTWRANRMAYAERLRGNL